jgi:tRNA pseudouridine38-40 synthase
MTNNYRVVVHFDGTEYYGWQFQTPKYPTIQAELIRVLKIIAKKQVMVTGSSRTDAGVHSSGLTANFHLPVAIEPDSLKRALNSLLPRDIRIMECAVASGVK